MASLYWLEASLPGIPPALWMSLGLGLPWALALLRRGQWRSRTLVGALALALGPAWMTAWMLLLGLAGGATGQPLLTAEFILTGSVAIATVGAWLAWRKRRAEYLPAARSPLALDEKAIICLVAAALILRWLHTAYFPFTAYDALWVYGYQGRLYFHEGLIPQDIAYYPQFLPLQFAYVQTLLGEINDHAARMVLPLLHVGSLLAAYQLGARLIGRRTGLYCAALWSLHPHVGQWAYVGDLEIPLAFAFTLAAVFFLSAWQAESLESARRDGLLAGIVLGVALFTKPTAGAFVWGLGLCLAAALILSRRDLARWRIRLHAALWTGLACLPLGGVWYARNWLLGHEVVTFPKSLWLTRALRSGDYLMPLIVALAAGFLAFALIRKLPRRRFALGMGGLALVLAGALASNSTLFPQRVDPPASHIEPVEATAMAAGLFAVAFSLREIDLAKLDDTAKRAIWASGWAILLAMPYFVTYFFSYSYHYRLGFAVMPLLCLPTAAALSLLVKPDSMTVRWRRVYLIALTLICLPGVVSAAFDARWSSIWILRGDLHGDWQKRQVFNPSLTEVVAGLKDYLSEEDTTPIVVAPGEERLPFFFPQTPILDRTVTRLDELETLGATHFIYGAKARAAYLDAGIDPLDTQVVAALGRSDIIRQTAAHDEAFFSYELYEVGTLHRRRESDSSSAGIFGGKLQLLFASAYPPNIFKETPITLQTSWRALQPMDSDYRIVAQLYDPVRRIVVQEWTLEIGRHRHGAYTTRHWQLDEIARDNQALRIHAGADFHTTYDMTFRLGVWDGDNETWLPLTINGKSYGDFYRLPGLHRIRL